VPAGMTDELVKIMVHPRARGGRLGQLVTQALIASAADEGIETLHLDVAVTTSRSQPRRPACPTAARRSRTGSRPSA